MDTLFSLREKSWKPRVEPTFTFIDLFAGIGGFRIALERLGGECLFTSEINEECAKTYAVNFGEYPDGDIKNIDKKRIREHDILCAGFPCQPFSISGHKKGFEDPRGTLFFDILEIIREKKPKIVFLENVKHLKYHNKKKTLETILESLENLGYKTSWNVLNAKDFGVAQNRERIIILGTRKKKFDFSAIETDRSKEVRDILDKNGDFEFLEKDEYTILPKKQWKRQTSGLIFCGYRNKKLRKNGIRPDTKHLSRVHKQPNRIYHIDGKHPTLPSQESAGRFWIYDGKKVRKMTINECFKLQGFPEDFEKISNTGACYNQIGNAVAVPMIESICREMMRQKII